MSGQTITEKILSRVVGRRVAVGEIIYPEPDLITVHDWYVVNIAQALDALGVEQIRFADRVIVGTDHEPVAVTPQAAERQRKVRQIVARYGIERFHDVGRGGLTHMFPIESGDVRPGMFVEAYDTHVTNFGAVGALAIPLIVEITEVLACGSVWLRVPETVRVTLTGRLTPGTMIRDVAQKLIADMGPDLADYAVVEFGGAALRHLDIAQRQTLCNTPMEIGAKSALVEADAMTKAFVEARSGEPFDLVASDADAVYRCVLPYNLDDIEPQVAAPPTPDHVVPVTTLAGRPIDHAFIGSCASSSLDDLRSAAALLQGRTIHPRVRLFVTPGTQRIMADAEAEGLLRIFVEAGCVVTAPGCGPCAAGRIGGIASGEVSINTGTRNDPGRLGSRDAEIFLASPLTVAASAIAGAIADPRSFGALPR